MNSNNIYFSSNCRKCGLPYNNGQAITPNGHYWEHTGEGCLYSAAHEILTLKEEVRKLKGTVEDRSPIEI